MRHSGPRYVDSSTLQVFPPPSLCQDVTQHLFFLEADARRLQALCDTFLNRPSGGAVDYRPLGRYVMLSFQHIGRLASAVPEFRDRGYTEEREATVWVPVGDFKKHGPVQVLQRMELFIPYIYTDNAWAVAGGGGKSTASPSSWRSCACPAWTRARRPSKSTRSRSPRSAGRRRRACPGCSPCARRRARARRTRRWPSPWVRSRPGGWVCPAAEGWCCLASS